MLATLLPRPAEAFLRFSFSLFGLPIRAGLLKNCIILSVCSRTIAGTWAFILKINWLHHTVCTGSSSLIPAWAAAFKKKEQELKTPKLITFFIHLHVVLCCIILCLLVQGELGRKPMNNWSGTGKRSKTVEVATATISTWEVPVIEFGFSVSNSKIAVEINLLSVRRTL